MSIITSPLLLGADKAAGYTISRSLRFNSSDSASCSRSFTSAGNRRTWTLSLWVKRSAIAFSAEQHIWGVTGTTDATYGEMFFGTGDTLRFAVGYTTTYGITTTRVFRDPSAWYHIVLAFDATQSTATNKIKLYINGVEETTFSSDTRSSLANQDWGYNNNVAHFIGRNPNGDIRQFNGYLAEIHFIDGQALTPSSFAETNATTGQWVPKAFSGGSYGTNGFKLDFADNSAATAAALGKDTSGNGNNWTPVNLIAVPAARQGYKGGDSYQYSVGNLGGGGGGGAGAPGSNGVSGVSAGAGGAGRQSSITGSAVYYGGGGGGGSWGTAGGAGGLGGGGAGKLGGSSTGPANPGTNGLGGGGGGAGYSSADWQAGGAGGSGRVIIRYPTSYGTLTSSAGGSLTTVGSDYVYQWTSVGTGSITFPGSSTIPVQYLVLGGGGGAESGGGGGGGMLEGTINISGGSSQTITVGAGGAGASPYPSAAPAANGGNSVFASITALGGGRGGGGDSGAAATSGGSGGGGGTTTGILTGGAGTGNNQSDIDSLVDTPSSGSQVDTGLGGQVTGNYATLNPLAAGFGSNNQAGTLSNGNLDWSTASTTYFANAVSTIAPRTGKYYVETICQNASYSGIGFVNAASISGVTGNYGLGAPSDGWFRQGTLVNNNTSNAVTGMAALAVGDIVGLALDLDNGKAWWSKNGVWHNSGDPASGTNATVTFTPGGKDWLIGLSLISPASAQSINFGQRQWAYAAPSGFRPLVDTLLPAPVVAKPNTVMDVVTYTGTGASRSITGLGFSPDFVWIKERGAAGGHNSYDTVRGASVYLASESTNAEGTDTDALTAFNSNGFSLGSGYTVKSANGSGRSYVAWTWDAGSSTVTNTQGSITSQVRANPSAGFSIVSYSGNSTNATVGHGLNAKPAFLIVKNRAASYWMCWHVGLGGPNSTSHIYLQTTEASGGQGSYAYWGDNTLNSSVFSVGPFNSSNATGSNYIAYLWAPVAGYSSFGSYTGNGSADGPFVYTGFRPKFVLIKGSSFVSNWNLLDGVRDSYNVADKILRPNLSNAELNSISAGSGFAADFLSNGFKLRASLGDSNSNAETFVWAAFAESPFAYSRAR